MKKIPKKESSVKIKKEKIKIPIKKDNLEINRQNKKPAAKKEQSVILPPKKIFAKKELIAKQANPIYFKIGHDESVDSKKDLLVLESSLLNIAKIMRDYNGLRAEELKIKVKMHRTIKELDSSIKRTKAIFPFLEIPERLRRKEIITIKTPEEITPVKEEVPNDEIELQLREIQSRLKSLGG